MHSSSERVKQTLYRVKLQINLKYDFFSQGKNVSKLLCLINWASWSEPLAYVIYLSHIMIIKKRTFNGKNTAVLSPRPLLYVQQFLIHCHLYSSHLYLIDSLQKLMDFCPIFSFYILAFYAQFCPNQSFPMLTYLIIIDSSLQFLNVHNT